MPVTLRTFTPDEYRDYYARSVKQFAEECVQSGHWTAQEAPKRSEEKFQQLLPEGLDTPGHDFYAVTDSPSGERVGLLWTHTRGEDSFRHTFIYDIEMEADQQGKGYGSQTLERLQEIARQQGARSIQLHVFGHNSGAIRLYERLGVQPTNINMRLDL